MILRLAALATCLLVSSPALGTSLRVSAQPPLSGERLADAIRSYVEGVELEIAPGQAGRDGLLGPPGLVEISLRRVDGANDEVELVLIDREETILRGLPRTIRAEDLYRAAALKVHALLERRPSPVDSVGVRETAATPYTPARLILDAGVALLVPSAGPARESLRLAAGLRLASRCTCCSVPTSSPDSRRRSDSNGTCGGSRCVQAKGSCSNSRDCCSGDCAAGKCAGPKPECRVAGESCAAEADCCSGQCTAIEEGVFACALLSGCRVAGETCSNATDCCAGLCQPAAAGMVNCKSLPGCKVVGERCTEAKNCCSG